MNVRLSEILIDSFIAGDVQALEKITRLYYPALLQFVGSHVKSPEVAKTLVKAAIVETWQNRESISDRALDQYLKQTLTGLMLKHLEKAAVDHKLEKDIWSHIQKTPEMEETPDKARESIARIVHTTLLKGQLTHELTIP